MRRWTTEWLARAAGGRIVGGSLPLDAPLVGISTDTRTLVAGEAFVALRGQKFDAHDHVEAAVVAGAAALVVEDGKADAVRAVAGAAAVIAVPDTLFALGEIARVHRSTWRGTLYAVTGSAGKTTTKEMMAAALSKAGTVHKTAGNWNNRVGLPKTLLGLRDEHQIAVIEMGTSEPGEIARLAAIAAPKIGVITNIGSAHLEKLGSLDGVAKEKGALFAALPHDGVAVVNVDDARVVDAASRSGAAHVTFGTSEEAQVRVLTAGRSDDGRIVVMFDVQGHTVSGPLAMLGHHNAVDAAAAIACAVLAGVTPEAALAAVSEVVVGSHRLSYVDAGGINVLDDSYNANPVSMEAGLATLTEYAGPARKLAVLGEMMELGTEAAAAHRELGAKAARIGLARLWAVGAYAEAVREGAVGAGLAPEAVITAPDAADISGEVLGEADLGDWVLVKGSRGGRLERVVEELTRGGVC
ncbi:MAG: UDP-N-acetylmuramoyl-tripeptide--D-alanyl-D-alanine ligase [Myxococcales bacterium]